MNWRPVPRICLVVTLAIIVPSTADAQGCPNIFAMQDLEKLAHAKRKATAEVEALHPAIAVLAANVAKSYACKGLINFYATNLGLPDDLIGVDRRPTHDALVLEFRNKAHPKESVCGSLRYQVPRGLPGHDAETLGAHWLNWAMGPFRSGIATTTENSAFKEVVKSIHDAFIATEGQIATGISGMIRPYLPSGKDLPRPRVEYIRSSVRGFQTDIASRFTDVAQTSKWRPDELARFVSVSACASLLPVATGPDERLLAQYPSAFADYMRFKTDFDAGWTP